MMQSTRSGLEGAQRLVLAALAGCVGMLAMAALGPLRAEVALEDLNVSDATRYNPLGLDTRTAPARPEDSPLTTRFTLNGVTVGFEARGIFKIGAFTGNRRNLEPNMNALIGLEAETEASIINGIGVRRQVGWFAQVSTVDRRRTIELRRRTPVELIGFDLNLTVTGGCLAPGAAPGSICTFTPGLTVGPDDLDPATLLPRTVRTDSAFGQQIDPRTHQALQSGDFVRSAPDLDERVGLALQIPNAGQIPDGMRMGSSSLGRSEQTRREHVFALSRVEQALQSSDTEAALNRTVRGFVFLEKGAWNRYSVAAQLAAWVLPEMRSTVASAGGPPSGLISNNLFLAANNVRYPTDSFTMFQTGAARVAHSARQPRTPDETPAVVFNSFWIGVSPVREVSRSVRVEFRPIEPRRVESSSFWQGGVGVQVDDVAGRITVIDDIAREITTLELQNIADLYVQTGINLTRQRAVQEVITRQSSSYKHVPHFSFTGNRTDGRSVVRYYIGVLDPSQANFYAGADYTRLTEGGFRLAASAIAYSRPDRDYYTHAEVSLAQTNQMRNGDVLTVGAVASADFNRPDLLADTQGLQDGADRVTLFGQLRGDWGSLTIRTRASNLRSNDKAAALSLGAALSVFDRASLSLEATPRSTEDAYVQLRLGFSIPIAPQANAPVFRIQYARVRYDFSRDTFGQRERSSEDTLLAGMQVTF